MVKYTESVWVEPHDRLVVKRLPAAVTIACRDDDVAVRQQHGAGPDAAAVGLAISPCRRHVDLPGDLRARTLVECNQAAGN